MSSKLRTTQKELEKVKRELEYRNDQFKKLKKTSDENWQTVLILSCNAKRTRKQILKLESELREAKKTFVQKINEKIINTYLNLYHKGNG